jgi:hypothetical protein
MLRKKPRVIAGDGHLARSDHKSVRTLDLPLDVLVEIFKSVVASASIKTVASSAARLVTITHVCKHWRDTALSYAVLWHQPLFTRKARLTRVMLERSRNNLLTIAVDIERLRGSKGELLLLDILSSQAHRIRVFDLRATEHQYESVAKLLCGSFPSLVLLSLLVEKHGRRPKNTSLDITAMDAPQLKHLSLNGVSIPNWCECQSVLERLTSATFIGQERFDAPYRMPYSTLSSLVGPKSSVKDLTISSALPVPEDGPKGLHMPQVSCLSLADKADILIDHIGQLKLSSESSRSFYASFNYPTYKNRLVPALVLHLIECKQGPISHMSICSDVHAISLRLWSDAVTRNENMSSKSTQLPWSTDTAPVRVYAAVQRDGTDRIHSKASQFLRWESALISGLPLEKLRTLCLSHHFLAQSSASEWVTLLSPLNALENLYLYGESVAFGPRDLGGFVDSQYSIDGYGNPEEASVNQSLTTGVIDALAPASAGFSTPALACLTLLCLVDIRFNEWDRDYQVRLTTCLAKRRDMGMPLERLVLKNCYWDSEGFETEFWGLTGELSVQKLPFADLELQWLQTTDRPDLMMNMRAEVDRHDDYTDSEESEDEYYEIFGRDTDERKPGWQEDDDREYAEAEGMEWPDAEDDEDQDYF